MQRKIVVADRFPFSVENADVIVVRDQFAIVMYSSVENGSGWVCTKNSIATDLCVVFNNGSTKQMYENVLTDTISQSDLSLNEEIWRRELSGIGWNTGWNDWVSSSGVYSFTIDQTRDVITVIFYRREMYGNFEYSNGERIYQYTLAIKLGSHGDSFSEEGEESVSFTEVVTKDRQPY